MTPTPHVQAHRTHTHGQRASRYAHTQAVQVGLYVQRTRTGRTKTKKQKIKIIITTKNKNKKQKQKRNRMTILTPNAQTHRTHVHGQRASRYAHTQAGALVRATHAHRAHKNQK